MTTNRRDFLRMSALAGSGLGLGLGYPASLNGHGREAVQQPRRVSRILLLGGTGFIGPWQVNRILSQGHELTLFNRGRSQPRMFQDQFAGLENLIGDRDGDLSSLEGNRTWDVVIDNSGYTPDQVRATARLLVDRTDQYLFISTQAAYMSRVEIGIDEDAPVGQADLPMEEWEGYGPMKALAEQELQSAFGDRCTIVRPGLVAGPGDRSDRFTYWCARMDRGGEVLAPNTPMDPVQYIDVRDLAEFMVHLLEQETRGVYNVIGPEGDLHMEEFLYGIKAATSTPSSLTFVDSRLPAGAGRPPLDRPAGLAATRGTDRGLRAHEPRPRHGCRPPLSAAGGHRGRNARVVEGTSRRGSDDDGRRTGPRARSGGARGLAPEVRLAAARRTPPGAWTRPAGLRARAR